MKIQTDKNSYIIGYATVGGVTDGIDVEYDETIFEYGFEFYRYGNGKIIFDENKYNEYLKNEEKKKEISDKENQIKELQSWLENYDKEYATYERCKRLGIIYDGDIETLNAEAVQKQNLLNELNSELLVLTAE